MTTTKPKVRELSAFERYGVRVSSGVSDIAASPFGQLGVIVVCGTWFLLGLNANLLTAVLSILAISLTQMVLNRQNEREAEAHRRDVAMHAKLDELVLASKLARDEMAGIEDLEEEEIIHLKEDAKDAIHAVAEGTATPAEREEANVAEEAIKAVGVKSDADGEQGSEQGERGAPAKT